MTSGGLNFVNFVNFVNFAELCEPTSLTQDRRAVRRARAVAGRSVGFSGGRSLRELVYT